MTAFTVIYVAAVITAFVIYMVKSSGNAKRKKYCYGAEKLIRDDMLEYSLKNPFRGGNPNPPSSKRLMLAVKTKAAGQKQTMVFDPLKPVYVGRDKDNHIRLYNPGVSGRQAVIFYSDGKLWIKNTSSSHSFEVKKGLFNAVKTAPGKTVRLKNGNVIRLSGSRIKVIIFIFDINFN